MIFTNAYNNLINVFNNSNYQIFRYEFQRKDYRVSVIYTKNSGMGNQITLLITGKGDFIVFPVYFVIQDKSVTVNTYIDPELFGLLLNFFYQYRIDNKISTNTFFKDLRDEIEQIDTNNIVQQNVQEIKNSINHGYKPTNNYNLPFFQTLVHRQMGKEMCAKIRRIYPDATNIINFLNKIKHTLRFTNDPTLAQDLYIVLQAEGYESP